MRTAIVIGATGVTGQYITKHLLDSDEYSQVTVFSRRALGVTHPKLTNHEVDFDRIKDWAEFVCGDDLFSALGTTVKLAGSKSAQYLVDYTYQAGVCEAAANNGLQRLFLISSPQASPGSPLFYNRMKGELDAFVATLGFSTLVYFKPSIIEGDRADKRLGERIGGLVVGTLAKHIPAARRFRPISGAELGQAIVCSATAELAPGTYTYELGEIFELLETGP